VNLHSGLKSLWRVSGESCRDPAVAEGCWWFYLLLKELEVVRLDTSIEPVLTGLYRREAVVPAFLTFLGSSLNVLDDHGGDRVQLG